MPEITGAPDTQPTEPMPAPIEQPQVEPPAAPIEPPSTPDPAEPVMLADNSPNPGPLAVTYGADDLARGYLKHRTDAAKDEALQWLTRGAEAKPVPHNQVATPAQDGVAPGVLDKAAAVAKDIGKGLIEAPSQVVGGMADALNNAIKPIAELGQWVEDATKSGAIVVDGEGIRLADNAEVQTLRKKGKMAPTSLPTTHAPDSATGGLVRSVSQFLTGFLPATAALKATGAATALGTAGTAMAAGAITDATVFDAHAERLSNLIQEHPALANPVTEYLSAQPDDSEAEGRFKNAVEGLALGQLADGFVRAVRALRPILAAKAPAPALDAAGTAAEDIRTARESSADMPDLGKLGDPEAPLVADAPPPKAPTPDGMPPVGPQKTAGFLRVAAEGADGERAININLARLNTSDDVKAAIDATAKTFAPGIEEARRGVITHEQTSQMADELGMTVDDLLARQKGQAWNAEQLFGARRLLVSSGTNLVELAKAANGPAASDIDRMAFRRALSVHSAIQSQVSGMTADAGRALSQFRMMAGLPGEAQTRAIKEMLGDGNTETMAKMVASLDTPEGLNTFVRQAERATTKDMLMEAWINGLLSGPQTHVVNMLSNAATAVWQVPERMLASGIRRLTGGEGVAQGEGMAQAFGMLAGFQDGLHLAWQALKTGEPSDAAGKLEVAKHRAITAENLDMSGVPGRAVDFVGEVVRAPGRALMASDELWKATGYRMELYAQAYRAARNEGLQGEQFGKRVASIVQNPPEHIQMAAIDAAHYQTFTKELGAPGTAFTSFVNKTPGARLVFPFIRTPTNILKFVGERTLLAPLSTAVRADVAAGGARRDMALAKMATGSMLMAVAADYAGRGVITGAGPTDPDLKATLRRTGWQPYSIKVDDTWYSYNRADPLGSTIGLAADAAEIIGQLDTAKADELAAAVVIAASNNVVNKSYLQGFSTLAGAFNQMSPEAGVSRGKRIVQQLAGTLIPTGVATIERTLDPTLRDAQSIVDQIRSRVPGYSKDLPPTRNLWGEPVVLSGGLGPDIMSPIYASTETNSPADKEMERLRIGVQMPERAIDGVELKPEEYSRYVELAGHDAINPQTGLGAKAAVERLINSPEYLRGSDGPDGTKALAIRSTIIAYRQIAKAHMRREFPELAGLIDAHMLEQTAARAGGGFQGMGR